MEQNPKDRSRENMLAVALACFVGGVMLFFLFLISLGIVGNVLIGAGMIAVVGALHYFVWGRSFSEEIAAEREALKRQDARVSAKKPAVAPDAIQDLGRTRGIQEK